MTQATGPGSQPQVQTPVIQQHPIHEETATHNALTEWVKNNPDNDPHQGTDMELPQPEAPEAEVKAEEAPKEPTETEETIEFDEETPFFELEYNGRKEKLSAKQLREGYLAKQDYHRNIQKVKAEEAALQERIKSESLKSMQEYVDRLEVQKQAVQKLAGVRSLPEIEALSRTDPATAQQEFLRLLSVNQTYQAIETEQRQAQEKLASERQAALNKEILKTRETLEKDIPGWNEETYRKVMSSVVRDYGFENKDVEQVYDARLIKVLHDAYQYRQLQKAKPEASKKVVAVPKVLKPGTSDKPATSSAADEAAQRLQKSGRGEDFVQWYMAKQKQQKRK